MKRILLNSLLAAGLLTAQIACAANDSVSPGETGLEALTQRCADLSQQSGNSYQLMVGKVVEADLRGSDVDCFPSADRPNKCPPEKSATLTVFQQLASKPGEPHVVIFTPEEDASVLSKKGLYMTKDKSYAFCARDLKRTSSTGEERFLIDDVTTIQEIKNTEPKATPSEGAPCNSPECAKADPAFLRLLRPHHPATESMEGK